MTMKTSWDEKEYTFDKDVEKYWVLITEMNQVLMQISYNASSGYILCSPCGEISDIVFTELEQAQDFAEEIWKHLWTKPVIPARGNFAVFLLQKEEEETIEEGEENENQSDS